MDLTGQAPPVPPGAFAIPRMRPWPTSDSIRICNPTEAEFLVLGQLLIRGIPTYKTYMRHPDYDLIVTNPEKGRTKTIQVKSRYATDYDRSFSIKKFGADFVVHVALNRGNRGRRLPGEEIADPEYYVFPMKVVRAAHDVHDQRVQDAGRENKWHKTFLKDIPRLENYRDKWESVRKSLGLPEVLPPQRDES